MQIGAYPFWSHWVVLTRRSTDKHLAAGNQSWVLFLGDNPQRPTLGVALDLLAAGNSQSTFLQANAQKRAAEVEKARKIIGWGLSWECARDSARVSCSKCFV